MNTAVVTGASSGIGQAITESLLRKEWKVYGLSRSKPSFTNNNFTWLKCDLVQPQEISGRLDDIAEEHIDLLISNAGVAFEEPATSVTAESFHRMYSVNVLAPMLIVSGLKAKIRQATIISISSVSDRIAETDFVLYGSSKAANTRFFDTLAEELPQAKVYTLLPDYVETPMLHGLNDGTDFDWSQTIAVKDLAQLTTELAGGKHDLSSGSNIIVVNERLKEDLKSTEKVYGFNIDTGELTKL